MVTLTANEIGLCVAKLRWGPGGTPKTVTKFLDTAIAIVLAESGGNPYAHSSTDDWGLWQINRHYHPEYFSETLGIFNPVYNTGAAKEIYRQAGDKFTPWSTYKNGSYRSHLGNGATVYRYLQGLDAASFDAAVTTMLTEKQIDFGGKFQGSADWQDFLSHPDDILNGISDEIPDFLKPFGGVNPFKAVQSVPDAIKDFTDKLIQGGKVAGLFVLAVIILILGVLFLLKDTAVGKTALGALNPAKKATAAAEILS